MGKRGLKVNQKSSENGYLPKKNVTGRKITKYYAASLELFYRQRAVRNSLHSTIIYVLTQVEFNFLMNTPAFWIDRLKLTPHPEGGFYRETYRSVGTTPGGEVPSSVGDPRNFSTAIYFLLRSEDRSFFHRIKSDELWHFHVGACLSIFVLGQGGLTVHKLGSNPDNNESLQVVIPANHWFGARLTEPDRYTLSGCTVAPGFDFRDFELATRTSLIKQFPSFEEIIRELTPEPKA